MQVHNYLYYNTPENQLQEHYRGHVNLFTSRVTTKLPNNVIWIRLTSIAFFTTLAAIKLTTTVFFWPAIIVGASIAGYNLYKQVLKRDELVDAFHRFAGRDGFEGLSEIRIPRNVLLGTHGATLSQWVTALNWDDLGRIQRARTLDHRDILIIKGFSRNPDGLLVRAHTKKVMVFVEKLSKKDFPRGTSRIPDFFNGVFRPFTGNTNEELLTSAAYSGAGNSERREFGIYSSISPELNFEISSQLRG